MRVVAAFHKGLLALFYVATFLSVMDQVLLSVTQSVVSYNKETSFPIQQ